MIPKNLKPVVQDLMAGIKKEYYSHNIHAIDSMIYLTYRCTSKCKTCNIWKRNSSEETNKEMSWEEWNNILINLKNYGIKSLEIFGGDALLRKDLIYEVIKFCYDNGIETYFPTNSILLDRETAKKLVESGLGTIYISLDDVGLDHDTIRGKTGAFKSVKDAIENIVDARQGRSNPHIVICSTISKMNYNHLGDIIAFLDDYPIDAIYPRVLAEFTEGNISNSMVDGIRPEPYFTSTDNVSHLMTNDQLKSFRESVRNQKKKNKGVYVNYRAVDVAPDEAFTQGTFPMTRCLVCSTLVTVDPSGNVVPCPMYNKYHLGNLKECKLEDIWGNERHKQFVSLQRKHQINICSNCVMRPYYPSFSETCSYYLRRVREKIID